MSSDVNMPAVLEVDARRQQLISDDQAEFFRQNGLLVLRNLLSPDELGPLQEQTLGLIDRAEREASSDPYLPDFAYRNHEITGNRVPSRVEYVIDKTPACKALLGHPFILRSVEKLQGPSFIPTWDSMVFKFAGQGAAIPWHRDAGIDCVGSEPIFNVDFYLDRADLSNCVWGIPGTNRWSDSQAQHEVDRRNRSGFVTDGAAPIKMNPGDVLFHDILALHGSPPTQSPLRRVIYYEFRPAETERQMGPHIPEYIPLKQQVLLECLRFRRTMTFAQSETPFEYRPAAEFAASMHGAELATLRYPHEQFWRLAAE